VEIAVWQKPNTQSTCGTMQALFLRISISCGLLLMVQHTALLHIGKNIVAPQSQQNRSWAKTAFWLAKKE
jgi:hypothetical protein